MSKLNLEDYIPLLHKIAKKYPKKHKDDLISEGYLALHRASKNYDPEIDTPFESYAYKEVLYTMQRFVKNESNGNLSLDNVITDVDGNEITYADLLESETDVAQEIENKDYYDKNLAASSTIERFIKQRHYEEGISPKDIAELYSEFTLIKDIRTIKKILKK